MKKCIKCGNEISDDSKFCAICGSPQDAPVTPVVENPAASAPQQPVQNATPATPAAESSAQAFVQDSLNKVKSIDYKKVCNDTLGDFKTSYKKTGIKISTLLGIIAAIMLIFAPFINFVDIDSTVKYNPVGSLGDLDDLGDISSLGGLTKIPQLNDVKFNVSDGLNLFELKKLSGAVDTVCDNMGVEKKQAYSLVEFSANAAKKSLTSNPLASINASTIDATLGIAKLVLYGRFILIISPFIMLLSGIALLFFTMINNKLAKLITLAFPAVSFIWLFSTGTNFFSMMSMGAGMIIIAIALGVVSALKDTK